MKIKMISILSILALLFSVAAMSFVSASVPEPVVPEDWTADSIGGDQDFTLAFVGDIQALTEMDYKSSIDADPNNDTAYVDALFNWIAENADDKKIKHVFTLGDLTEFSSENDPNLSYAAKQQINNASGDKEWIIVKNAISQLDGVVPYSIARGNHDDYQIDDFFNYEAYTENFNGFYREESGNYQDSITNSYRLVTLGDYKFIFITVDFNPTRAVVTWMDELLTKYSDHNAIITMHSYIGTNLQHTTIANLQTVLVAGKYNGAAPDWIWKNCLKNHKNVIMTVCGHLDGRNTRFVMMEGDNGNEIANIMVNPQLYDKETQPTGMVFLMHFYNGGKTVKTEYYSTFLDLYKVGSNYEWEISGIVLPAATTTEAPTEAPTTEAPTTEAPAEATTEAPTTAAVISTAEHTTAEVTTAAPESNNCKSSISLVSIAMIPAFATVSATALKKKRKDG